MTREEKTIELHSDELYPKFDRTDENGNELRDARFYSFTTRTIASVNRMIRPVKYQQFNIDEIDY